MKWIQIKVKCKTSDIDAVSAIMGMIDSSLMIEDYSDIEEGANKIYGELLDDTLLQKDRTMATVSLFLPESLGFMEQRSYIKESLESGGIQAEVFTDGVEDEDWATSWKEYYKPVKIGKRTVIVPLWEPYTPQENEVVVTIDPGMAFGTGMHETTRLCALLLERYMKSGLDVLDVGTGSGILAICMAKYGASQVMAYDIDPMAVKEAEKNAELNAVNNMTCKVSDLLAKETNEGRMYDLVCANIVPDIVIRLLGQIPKFLKKDALLICSGIVESRVEEVIEEAKKHDLVLLDQEKENDWCGVVFRKKHF